MHFAHLSMLVMSNLKKISLLILIMTSIEVQAFNLTCSFINKDDIPKVYLLNVTDSVSNQIAELGLISIEDNDVITWSRYHSDNESTRSIIFEYKNSSFLTIFNDSLDKAHGAKDSILSINDQGYDGECIWIDSP